MSLSLEPESRNTRDDAPDVAGASTQDRSGDAAPPESQRRSRLQITMIVVAAVGLLAIGLVAAAVNGHDKVWAGTVLPEPQAKPAITLTDTSGKPYDLRARTEGRFTVLMFGYTSCPDVCPINLGTLDSAMQTMGPQAEDRVDVVFVTVDPRTDTPERIRTYLDRFDTRFVGLTGTPDQLRAAQEAAKVPIAAEAKGEAAATGSSGTIGHATQMIVYAPDGDARIVYPFGTRQSDWTRDLPRLLAGEEPRV